MSLSLKKRIATHFVLATAIIIAVVFSTVYFIVQQTVYKNIDNDLSFEANKHTTEIQLTNNTIHFINYGEWVEVEHREVQVNPVFIQLMDENGNMMDKSPNLKSDELSFKDQDEFGDHFNEQLKNRTIRQVQIPIIRDGETIGFIVAAMSLEASLTVLKGLRYTLFILYPIILIGLYFISLFLAGRSIRPVVKIIKTTNRITKENLKERVELPQNNDELFDLTFSINGLLDRIENAIEREKQFTSDASHELRTPISVIRGTLEVLIRKPRSQNEYEEKINASLTEIDRVSDTIDQLLELARFDKPLAITDENYHPLLEIIQQIIARHNTEITAKNIAINFNENKCDLNIEIHPFYSQLILDNIIGNAIKYSHPNSAIQIDIEIGKNNAICTIKDTGIGIKSSDLKDIYNPFFRSEALRHKMKGNGLGLSIAQKAANTINAHISIESEYEKGTQFTINFKEILRRNEA